MSYSYQNQDQAKTSIPSVDSVTKELSKLPGIGPRMAQRLT